MEKTEKEPRGFYVEKGSFFAHASVTLLVLSMAARLLGTMNLWGDMPKLIIQVLLPLGSALLFILFILFLGRIALWTTILPVLGGAAFFILTTYDGDPGWPLFICIALAFLAAFVYTATVSGMIRSKWLLVLILTAIFAYQIVLRALPAFRDTKVPLSFVDGMALLSSLGIVFSLILAALAFRRKKKAKADTQPTVIDEPVSVQPAVPESPATIPSEPETAFSEDIEMPAAADTPVPEQPVDPSADSDI